MEKVGRKPSKGIQFIQRGLPFEYLNKDLPKIFEPRWALEIIS
jgi:hypothetical protein